MEQQAQLSDAQKQEIERLRIATREISASTSDAFSLSMLNIPYNQVTYFSHQPQPGSNDSQIAQFYPLSTGISDHQHHPMLFAARVNGLSDSFYQDPLKGLISTAEVCIL